MRGLGSTTRFQQGHRSARGSPALSGSQFRRVPVRLRMRQACRNGRHRAGRRLGSSSRHSARRQRRSIYPGVVRHPSSCESVRSTVDVSRQRVYRLSNPNPCVAICRIPALFESRGTQSWALIAKVSCTGLAPLTRSVGLGADQRSRSQT